jgi:hypothetical protein
VSKQRAKGTAWETELLPRLRAIYGPDIHRAPLRGIHDNGDYVGTPFLHEAKNQQMPHFLQWAREARGKAGAGEWVVIYKGDSRTMDGKPLVLMDLALYEQLAKAWFDAQFVKTDG